MREAELLVQSHEYGALRELLRASLTSDEQQRAVLVLRLADHAYHRFSGRYEEAVRDLSGHERSALERTIDAQALCDFADAAAISWDRDDLFAFVARAGALCDAARLWVLEALYPALPVRDGIRQNVLRRDYPTLAKKFKENDYRWDRKDHASVLKSNKPIYSRLRDHALGAAGTDESTRQWVDDVGRCLASLQPLEDLRNAALHELERLSKEDIRNEVGGADPLDLLGDLVDTTIARHARSDQVDREPFHGLAQRILDELARVEGAHLSREAAAGMS
jgi:hypothetical protein